MVKVALRAAGAPVDVHHALASGAPFESVLRLARERAERADAPTVPAAAAKPTVRAARGRVDPAAHEPRTRPNQKELKAAAKVVDDVDAHYIKEGFARRRHDGLMELTRLGEIAFACARLIEGDDGRGVGHRQSRAVSGDPLFWMKDGGYMTKSGRHWYSGWRLTPKGRALVKAIGLGAA